MALGGLIGSFTGKVGWVPFLFTVCLLDFANAVNASTKNSPYYNYYYYNSYNNNNNNSNNNNNNNNNNKQQQQLQ